MSLCGKRQLAVLLTALAWLAADQFAKHAVSSSIPLGRGFSVVPGCFDIVHVLNRGAAFGFLNDPGTTWQFWLFGGAAVVVAIVIMNIARTAARSAFLTFGLGSILGGAAGNLVDRVWRRAVVDFLDVYWGQWHWPAFNVADIAICLGVVLAGFILLKQAREEKRGAE